MFTDPDTDLTSPSVLAELPGEERDHGLILTVVFHPQLALIGCRAELPADGSPYIIGRQSPRFSPEQGDPLPLGRQDVSRQALSLSQQGEQLLLRRLHGSSRCRVGGRELQESVLLRPSSLRDGVPILLGHSVVLLLRRGARAMAAADDPALAVLRGGSASMSAVRQQIARLAGTELDVLVRGETGTGKELVASAIHQLSPRSGGPLVSVNMSAIPAGLAAAALFGTARGAFTGATRATEGYFNQARGGSLFLDEIGDAPAEVQPQLLRALQQREVQAVGGAVHRVDVRVISATDAALDHESCDFKSALRHRLGSAEICMPPLREHPEDIGELLLHFLSLHCRQLNVADLLPEPGAPAAQIAGWAGLFHAFLGYDWPGNVRELANFAGQVVVASADGLAVPDHIRRTLLQTRVAGEPQPRQAEETVTCSIHEVGEAEFDRALEAAAYEVADTARTLGVSRQAIYRRIAESPRHRLATDVPEGEIRLVLTRHGGSATAAARELRVSASGLRARLRGMDLEWY